MGKHDQTNYVQPEAIHRNMKLGRESLSSVSTQPSEFICEFSLKPDR